MHRQGMPVRHKQVRLSVLAGWDDSKMIRMVVCEQNPRWFGPPQIFDDCPPEMCTVFCWAGGVDYEPTIRRINDVAICPVVGHLSGIVRDDPQNSRGGQFDSLRAARLRL